MNCGAACKSMQEVRVNRKAARRVAVGPSLDFRERHRGYGRRGTGRRGDRSQSRRDGLSEPPTSAPLRRFACGCCRAMVRRSAANSSRERLAAAEAHRRLVVRGTEAYRVVHGEGDLLPALVVDRYRDYLVLQTLNQGMDAAREWIVASLVELFSPRGIVARNDAPVRAREALPLESGVIYGEVPETVEFRMNGLLLHADLLHGQKTGAFLDQRENYVAAARYARGKALDCFTFERRLRAAPRAGLRIGGSLG